MQVISSVCVEATGLHRHPLHDNTSHYPTSTADKATVGMETISANNSSEEEVLRSLEEDPGPGGVAGVLLGVEKEGEGLTMESFEMSSLAAQEAEAMLDQLMIDDELSDTRIVGVAESHDLCSSSTINISPEIVNGAYVQDGSAERPAAEVAGDLVREAESTVDPAQRQRVEEHMTPATGTR